MLLNVSDGTKNVCQSVKLSDDIDCILQMAKGVVLEAQLYSRVLRGEEIVLCSGVFAPDMKHEN